MMGGSKITLIQNIIRHPNKFARIIRFLTKETVKMASLQFRIASFLKCAPFELEGKSVFRVKMFTSKWKLALYHLVHWIFSLQAGFLWISFFWSWSNQPFGEELAMHLLHILGVMFGWVFMMSLYLNPHACLIMLNQHDLIVRTAEEARVKISHWASHYFVILAVYYFAFALFGIWLIVLGIYLWKPTAHYNIYGHLPSDWQASYVVFAVFVVYEMLWKAWALVTLGTFFCYWCADIFVINDTLASLASKKMTTKDGVRLYRYLRLFCILFNDFNGSFFTVGFNSMLLITPIILIYLTLTATYLNIFIYLLLPLLAFFCLFLIMFFLPQHSKVGILSDDVVKILRGRLIKPDNGGLAIGHREHVGYVMADAVERGWLKKRIRALPAIGITIWFFGIYTLDTSQEMIVQLYDNVLLLLSL